MGIVDDLKNNVFNEDTDFLDTLANRRYDLREQPQNAFLNVLADNVAKKLPGHNMIISLSFERIVTQSPPKSEHLLGIPREAVRKTMCGADWWDQDCDSERCFEGAGSTRGNEIDAVIYHNNDCCLIEYQHSRKRTCYDFMKMFWMHQFLNKPFESLFVTQVTTKEDEGSTTFERFNQNIDRITPVLNQLIEKWSLLEIVDLSGSSRIRHLHWRP